MGGGTMIAEDLAEIIADAEGPASLCEVSLEGYECFCCRMIARPAYGTGRDPRPKLLAWASADDMPRGADWGYGLILADDLPGPLGDAVRGRITDARGHVWRIEAAKPIVEADPETGALLNVAWRLALRGTQRAARKA